MTMNRITIGLGKDNIVKDTLPKEEEDAYIEREAQRAEEKLAKENTKASAKAKLVAGEPLTEAEADTIVL
tara:strand:- start:62 stop:271 length:210 start_codon:yes stop_codon:yes gene_type:complete